MPWSSDRLLKHFLRETRCNVLAGLRLALFLPVRLLDFRVNPSQLFIFFALSIVLDFLDSFREAGLAGQLNTNALFYQAFTLLSLLAAAYGLSRWYHRPAWLLALPVVLFAASPLLLLFNLLHGYQEHPQSYFILNWAIFGYALVLLVRVWAVVSRGVRGHFSGIRRWLGVSLFVAALLLPAIVFPPPSLWLPLENGVNPFAARGPSVVSEKVLHAQPEIFTEFLANLQPERPGVTDLYFVGFAPYAEDTVFWKDMAIAQRVVDERLAAAGRSISLVNSPETLLEKPLATVSNLQDTLTHVSQIMNPEEDVLFLYLSSHGSRNHELAVEFPPLELNPLTPTALLRLLNQSRIKYRILVISACYSGSFIDVLKDPNTLIFTASDAEHTSFGCGNDEEMTYFGDAFFRQGLIHQKTFLEAFAEAKAVVSARERSEKQEPSNPSFYLGSAIAEKIKLLERP